MSWLRRGRVASEPFAAASRWTLDDRDLDAVLIDARRHAGVGSWKRALERLRANRVAWSSWIFLCVIGVLSALAPLLPLPSPKAMHVSPEPLAPRWPWEMPMLQEFEPDYWELNAFDEALVDARVRLFGKAQTGPWLGTDSKGRDVLSRIVWGSRTSLLVALAASAVSLVVGTCYGTFAALRGGKTERWMMRVLDVLYSLPFLFVVILVLTLISAPRADLGEPLVDRQGVLFVVIGAVYWLTMARVVRGQVLALKQREFVLAARVLGADTRQIFWKHVLPNVAPIALVYATLTIPSAMLAESFLSFVGLGIEPPRVSWGLLAVDGIEGLNPVYSFWWLFTFPSVAIGATLLALAFLGDGLRDALDPKTVVEER